MFHAAGVAGGGKKIIMGPISRLQLVVFDFAIRNASCDLQNEDKEVGFFFGAKLKTCF